MITEADTCRQFVVPNLQSAGWDTDPCSIAEQRAFTDGRIIPTGQTARRRPKKKADYTEADSLDALRNQIRDAVKCHFDEGQSPKIIRLHFVREEVIAA